MTALAGVLFLLLSGSSPVTFGQDLQPPQGTADQSDDRRSADIVRSPEPRLVASLAQAIVGGVLALAPVRFWASKGNKVFVPWVSVVGPPGSTTAGIIVDDGVPF